MLELSYILLSLIMIIILFLIGRYAINKTTQNPKTRKTKLFSLAGGLAFWHIYIFVLGKSQILTDLSFPPRFFLFMILPAFLFTGIFLYKNRSKNWVQVIPISWLTGYQTFRIFVESLLALTAAVGIIHSNVTIEGYNYDMIYAFTAPVMFVLIVKKIVGYKSIKLWNYLGLTVIASIIALFMTTLYLPHVYGISPPAFTIELGLYPYVLVAGFLMPSAVFIHVLSIIHLNHKIKKQD